VPVLADAPTATSVGHLWLHDFRGLAEVDLALHPGLTVLYGANGQGKTSLLEAIGWVARLRSFRGVPDAMVIRAGAPGAVVRAEVVTGERTQLFEAEIRAAGRNRIMCNRQPVARARDLHGLLRVTVFAPDDLALVKEGPAQRRAYLDELLTMLTPRYVAVLHDFERVLKQRNALLRGGLRDADALSTLEVFDAQFVHAAGELVRGRLRLLDRLLPAVGRGYAVLAGAGSEVTGAYDTEWFPEPLTSADAGAVESALAAALAGKRRAETERGLTLVGPHRDELRLGVDGLDARHQASQGEQRTLALALRLAGHEVVGDLTGAAPVLLLDDVFSELDPERSAALVRHLPVAQTLLTTAGAIPPEVVPERRLRIHDGRVEGFDG